MVPPFDFESGSGEEEVEARSFWMDDEEETWLTTVERFGSMQRPEILLPD